MCVPTIVETAGALVEKKLSTLPDELMLGVADALAHSGAVLALSSTCRALNGLLNHDDALWTRLSKKELGHLAPALAARSHKGSTQLSGCALYRRALCLRKQVIGGFAVVHDSVVEAASDCAVCACPCLPGLENFGFGAQGAVRRAAGLELEMALSMVQTPLECLSATLVPGGKLTPHVAMCVTSPPPHLANTLEFWLDEHDVVDVSRKMHANLLRAARDAGALSLALPTLGTGGQGMEPEWVCLGLAQAMLADVHGHPHSPLRVRLACFEEALIRWRDRSALHTRLDVCAISLRVVVLTFI